MGQYIVNGEVVSMKEDKPTATHLKRQANAVTSDWVMANKPGGQVVKVEDHELLPADADSYSIVPPFIFGRA